MFCLIVWALYSWRKDREGKKKTNKKTLSATEPFAPKRGMLLVPGKSVPLLLLIWIDIVKGVTKRRNTTGPLGWNEIEETLRAGFFVCFLLLLLSS